METRRDAFQAIADPTRRAIISLLAARPLNLNAIAENFAISRPAISQHIKILSECGLIVTTRRGRESWCTVELQELRQVSQWVEQYRDFWAGKLDALERHLSVASEEEYPPTSKI